MKKQPFVNFSLQGVSLTDFGLSVPSPFCSLSLANSEQASYTTWTLGVAVGGDSRTKLNIAAFEALIYQAAQTEGYANASGIPVSFMFGWLNDDGSVSEYLSYTGYTLTYSVSTSGRFMNYTLKGYASQAVKSSMPVLNIPALTGYVQPSAVVEGLAKAIKADKYYDLDIDHSDSPTLVSHNALTTSFTSYVRGDKDGSDNYDDFPGLLTLAKSYNASRDAAGVKKYKLSTLKNSLKVTPLSSYLKSSLTDKTPQCSSYAFWIDEPTMTKPGVIHFKDKSAVQINHDSSALLYGTEDSNVLTISGSYDGVAYNVSDMNFATVGFTLDEKGNTIVNDTTVTNSWASSVQDVYQTANIINDINALATQFSGNFNVTIAGSCKQYTICQPVSLIVMAGNTLSPVSGIYSITSVSHEISDTFVTTLKLQRLSISSANQTASGMGIYTSGSSTGKSTYTKTKNVISTGKVDFGKLYPTWQDIL